MLTWDAVRMLHFLVVGVWCSVECWCRYLLGLIVEVYNKGE